jgi:hypothetical protein
VLKVCVEYILEHDNICFCSQFNSSMFVEFLSTCCSLVKFALFASVEMIDASLVASQIRNVFNAISRSAASRPFYPGTETLLSEMKWGLRFER